MESVEIQKKHNLKRLFISFVSKIDINQYKYNNNTIQRYVKI